MQLISYTIWISECLWKSMQAIENVFKFDTAFKKQKTELFALMWNCALQHESQQRNHFLFFLKLSCSEAMLLSLLKDRKYVIIWIHFKYHRAFWVIPCWYSQVPNQQSKGQWSSLIPYDNFKNRLQISSVLNGNLKT